MFLRRKKKEEEDGEDEKKSRRKRKEEEEDFVWDKKRILIALGFILLLIFAAKVVKDRFYPETNILGESTTKSMSEIEKPDVQSPSLNLSSQVNSSLEDVKDSIENMDPEEVASSSPQIQKVLRDIQGIKNLPVDKARDACYSVCSRL